MAETTDPLPPTSGPDPRGMVVDMKIERELHTNYLVYAMSTIMDRALPDVRDGLKPSQRRILVAMHDLNLRPGRKHIKCAKIAGDTSGNYHPHGESVIYPTLVGMAQPWRMRVPLIDPQGNFGSIDGDPPAAMRYTEARMTQAAVDMLDDIKLDTVDFQPNYDERLMEPMVLPGKFPNLLINGGVGIAVGMATSLAPHNPGEIFDAITALIDEPDLETPELLEIVKGPDFPTGGVICGRRGIIDAYTTGRGRVSVRGELHVEEQSNGRQQLVIDAIPYQVVQNTLMERIVSAIKDERIKDISDVRNESGRSARTRIVCELRRGADPAVVENQLYQFTPLQQTFSIMNVALVNRQPRTLSLRELIQLYIEHRFEVVTRRTRHLLREAQKKAHILEGLIYAVCDIDEVIRIIRASQSREQAIEALMQKRFRIAPDHEHAPKIPARLKRQAEKAEGAGGVALTRVQAEAIGAMRLIQLVGLEIDRLVGDYAKLVEEIEGYELILSDRQRVLDIIKQDCVEMKARYSSPRMTRIEESETDIDIEALIKVEEMVVTISHEGYVKRVPLDTYRAQGRGGRGIIASDAKDGDFIEHLFVASTHDDLLCFTDSGRVFKIKVYEVPQMSRTTRGRAIVNLIDLRDGEKAVEFMPIRDFEKGECFLFFATEQGRVKRSSLRLYRNVNRSGLIAVNLNEGDALVGCIWTSGHDHVLLGTEGGMSIRFRESDARPMGRSAAGVKGIDLRKGDRVVGLVKIEMTEPDEEGAQKPVHPELDLLTATVNGYGKRSDLNEYLVWREGAANGEPQSRGGKGRIDIRTTSRNGPVVTVKSVTPGEGIMFITQRGMLVRMTVESISRIGRATQGVRLVNLKDGDRLIAAARVAEGESSEDADGAVATDPPDSAE
ncbi:MAG: DNA gyrase subunit A [Phycisphaeraceae bacterium]|nr:MAG: DNA gyrase subunit A [Phycisphaeraceae bacterium]